MILYGLPALGLSIIATIITAIIMAYLKGRDKASVIFANTDVPDIPSTPNEKK